MVELKYVTLTSESEVSLVNDCVINETFIIVFSKKYDRQQLQPPSLRSMSGPKPF